MRRSLAVLVLLAAAACGGGSGRPALAPTTTARSTTTVAPTTSTSVAVTSTTTAPAKRATPPRPSTTRPARPAPSTDVVEVAYRIEVRTTDPAGTDFGSVVDATLHDERGWQRARFRLVHRDDAEYVVMLAEPADAQELCKPYDVYSKYSCQNGPRVVLNAERWRNATPQWTGDLATYRQMLVNHEFGHLLGQHHPQSDCPVRGRPAAVMAQQSTELNGCLPNPWPLDWEVERAARHDEPLAPPYSR